MLKENIIKIFIIVLKRKSEMFWELTMLNRLYKTDEFCRMKCRMYNDRVIFALGEGTCFMKNLFKVQRDDVYENTTTILSYFNI